MTFTIDNRVVSIIYAFSASGWVGFGALSDCLVTWGGRVASRSESSNQIAERIISYA